jgi:serine/threonine-protein kinase RsbW
MNRVLDMCVPTTLDEVARSIEEVNRFLEGCEVAPRVMYTVNLVLEEVLTNILKYAHRDGKSHQIDLTVELNDEHVAIICSDDGHPFDPLSIPVPDLSLPIAEREPGGLGIHLVRKSCHSLEYRRNEGKNILKMHVKVKSDPPDSD